MKFMWTLKYEMWISNQKKRRQHWCEQETISYTVLHMRKESKDQNGKKKEIVMGQFRN